VSRHDNLGFELLDTHHDVFEIVNLKPEQHTIAIWPVVFVTNGTVVMIDSKPVQLKDQIVPHSQSLILVSAMIAPTAEQSLIPQAADLDVGDSDKGLWSHGTTSSVQLMTTAIIARCRCMTKSRPDPERQFGWRYLTSAHG
jgi:hypothetical protein